MQRPSITFYGGARELGGNQFLIRDNGTNALLDFGVNFDRWGKHYIFPSGPTKYRALWELTRLDLCPDFTAYPNFDGIYRQDYLRHIGRTPMRHPTIDGFVLSHAHLDHAFFLHFLRPDIPVYMDRHTKRILFSMQGTTGMQYSQYLDFKYAYARAESATKDGRKWLQGDDTMVSRDIRIIEPPKPFKVGGIEFEPLYVDHSMPGTCGFIVHTSAGTVVYSADLRLRGRRPKDTENFISEARKRKPDYLMCEGSLIWKNHYGDEDEVEEDISAFIENNIGLVVVSYAPRDLDRVLTLFNVAKKTKRKLVISTKQAYLLNLFGGDFGYPKTHFANIGIYVPKKGRGMLDTEEGGEEDYYRWERQFIEYQNRISADELNRNPRDYILCLSGAILDDLIEIEPPPGSVFIRAHPEPYTEEMELGEKVSMQWLERFNLLRDDDPRDLAFFASRSKGRQLELFRNDPEPSETFNVPQRHVTGHMDFGETAYVVNEINPRTLVPIHTLLPEDFKRMGFNGRIWIPERGSVLQL